MIAGLAVRAIAPVARSFRFAPLSLTLGIVSDSGGMQILRFAQDDSVLGRRTAKHARTNRVPKLGVGNRFKQLRLGECGISMKLKGVGRTFSSR